jgi:hypoxanthine phosphoribosyltransferase
MMTQKPPVLFSEETIAARVKGVGAEITRRLEGQPVAVIGLIKGCMIFMADLVRAVPLDLTCHYMRVTALREEGGDGPVRTDIVYSTETTFEGRHILLLDDVVDTGVTLNFLVDHIRERRPASLSVCALVDKPGDRKVDVAIDWALFCVEEPMPDRFLVGYGLDAGERYRGLPYIGTIPRPTPAGGERA